MAENLGITPVMNGGPPAPIEGTTDKGGGFGPAYNSAWWSNASATALTRTLGDVTDNTPVAHEDAVKAVKAQGLDPAFVPTNGMPRGALEAEMVRQSQIKYDQLKMTRSGDSGGILPGIAAGFSDPINLALPGAGLVGRVGLGLGGRILAGGAEAAGYVGAQRAAELGLTGHEQDLLSWTTLNQMTIAAPFGGLAHAAFGPRPLVRAGEGVTTDTVKALERTDAYAKAHGLDPNEVVSSAGAVGEHQVTAGVGRDFGLKGTDEEIRDQLKDPVVNKKIAGEQLDRLARKYGNDPEAIAVAYNDGPGNADAWIRAGRDESMLPRETQGYLSRLRGIPMQTRVAAGSLAMQQLASDNDVDVAPVFKTNPFKIRDEHDAEVSQLTTQAYQDAMPNPQRVTVPPDTQGRLDTMAKPPEAEEANFVQEAKQQIASIAQKEPPVPEGMTRLYRGETAGVAESPVPDWLKGTVEHQAVVEATGRWFTKEKSEAEHYAQTHGKGKMSYIDIPSEQVEQYLSANQPAAKKFSAEGRENSEYFVSKEHASNRQPLAPETENPLQRFNDAMAEAANAHEPGTNLTHDDLTKATQAAVNCGVMKGVSFAD